MSYIRKMTTTLLMLTVVSCATVSGTPVTNVDLKSLAAVGQLTLREYDREEVTQLGEARLSFHGNIRIANESNCNGVSLSTQTKTYVVFGDCPSGKSFMCDTFETCRKMDLDETDRDNHVYKIALDFSGLNYRVELYTEKLVYRVQESNCLIPYPHGCLINLPGWKDADYFEFTPDKQN